MVVNVHEAKTHFSRFLERAMAGEEIIIARNGMPLVRLTPVAAPEGERTEGLSKGEITISEDFDAPLPEELLDRFES